MIDAGFAGDDDGLGAIAKVEFVEYAADVGLDRLLRDNEARRDLSVREALCNQEQDLRLALGQSFAGGHALRVVDAAGGRTRR